MIVRSKHWWWVALAVVVVIGIWRVQVDVDMLNLLPQDEPTVQGLKLYQQHFSNARELIISLRTPDAPSAEKLARDVACRLRAETNLIVGVTWQQPWMEHPLQVAEFVGWLWLNQSPETFEHFARRLVPDQLDNTLADARTTLATSLSPLDIARRAFDPFELLNVPALTNFSGFSAEQGERTFASADGTFRVIFVQSRTDLATYPECAAWLGTVQKLVAEEGERHEGWSKITVRYTGRPAFVAEVASSMQRDLRGSILGTAFIIALLFWLTHRRWLPMLWLLALLVTILIATVAIGGLLLGPLGVISLGFAAVLLGLAVDYAVVHYQEALAHPDLSVPEIRRAIAPSILWAAITTISAFLVLNLGGLPGLAQLGSLVAIGITLSAIVMVTAFLPPLFPKRRGTPPIVRRGWWTHLVPQVDEQPAPLVAANRSELRRVMFVSLALVLAAGAVLAFRRPALDRTTDALRLRHDEAQSALEEVTSSMGIPRDSAWVIIPGRDEKEVYNRLVQAEADLRPALSAGMVRECMLPVWLWPRPEYQLANRSTALRIAAEWPELRSAALRHGFRTNALGLAEQITLAWAARTNQSGVWWPTNEMSQWLLKRFVARSTNQWLMMGAVYPGTNHVGYNSWKQLSSQLAGHDALLSGWDLLGAATLRRVQDRFWLLVLPMAFLVLLSLWLAFRRAREILLGASVLLLSGLCLLAVMALAGWSWNLLNLMAVPLILGTGVDYGLFIQMALRRHRGDLKLVRRSVGRALMLCGATAIAGFGSLAMSSNAGMASLGQVCAAGIAGNMLISVWLLPAWWRWTAEGGVSQSSPSIFYQAWLWRLGLFSVRILPAWLVRATCLLVAELHYRTQPARRNVVIQNLLPPCNGNTQAATKTARRLYHNFGLKLADLWKVESGPQAQAWLTNPGECEIITKAARRGKGVVLITMHLGNWEHGGILLAQLGLKLTVLTRAEPASRLTHIRIASRTQCGIDTLIIGDDGFAFVEVIRRLEAGAVLAIAMDRPPKRNPAEIEWFGRPFQAPFAAAELARASGCALVGVAIVRRPEGYAVRVMPEITYDRLALGRREARRELIQQILRAFEPQIRDHLDQWYQFVPIWPPGGRPKS